MKTLGLYVGISKQTEVLFLVLLGICCTIFDPSLFNLHSNLTKIWALQMDLTKFTETAELYVQYVTTGVVLVRTFTVHLYLAFYVVMLWPAIFEERPGLMLPWLTVGAVKCLAMGAVTLATALYVCLKYSFAKIACWEFLLAHIINQGPSIYMWFSVLSYYHDLKFNAVRYGIQSPSLEFGIIQRRHRARSTFASKQILDSFDDRRLLISSSTIDTLVGELITNKHKGTSRSLDCLLDLMAAEAKKEEILSIHDEAIEEDNTLSIEEKVMKMLKLSPNDVRRARYKKATSIRSGSWNKKLEELESARPTYRNLLEKYHSDYKVMQMKRRSSEQIDFSIIPSEAEVKVTYLSNPDVQLESNEVSVQSMNEPVKIPVPIEILPKPSRNKQVRLTKDVKVLSKSSKPVSAQTAPLKTISKSNTSSNKPAVINKQKPNYSKLPKRKKEEGSQVNTITEEVIRDIAGQKKPKSKSNAVKTKSLSYNVPEAPAPYSPFKYDGYTLAYMESQKSAAEEKKAAARRPTSGPS